MTEGRERDAPGGQVAEGMLGPSAERHHRRSRCGRPAEARYGRRLLSQRSPPRRRRRDRRRHTCHAPTVDRVGSPRPEARSQRGGPGGLGRTQSSTVHQRGQGGHRRTLRGSSKSRTVLLPPQDWVNVRGKKLRRHYVCTRLVSREFCPYWVMSVRKRASSTILLTEPPAHQR